MQVNDFLELVVLPALFWAGLSIAAVVAVRAATASSRTRTAEHYRRDIAVRSVASECWSAVIEVIGEIETSPGLYAVFPSEIRDRLLKAHEHARKELA